MLVHLYAIGDDIWIDLVSCNRKKQKLHWPVGFRFLNIVSKNLAKLNLSLRAF
jgi:hypothetical protein